MKCKACHIAVHSVLSFSCHWQREAPVGEKNQIQQSYLRFKKDENQTLKAVANAYPVYSIIIHLHCNLFKYSLSDLSLLYNIIQVL